MDEMDPGFMKDALRQARKGLGRTSPNPAVGAVVVKDGRVIARGYHRRAGLPHAEVEALDRAGRNAEGATLYVTLEPCNHQGRTPPCTEAILSRGIRHVVVGMKDPNPDVAGGGCEFLARNGVRVTTGVLEAECRRLNEAFIHFVTRRRPFVMVKSALTLDGWTATATGHSRWITNEQSRAFVHRLRDRCDAVMVGLGTVLSDDPALTTRLKRGNGRDPMRIIVDTHLRTPPDAKILNHCSDAETCIAAGPAVAPDHRKVYDRPGVSVLTCPLKNGRIDLAVLMDMLGKMSVTSLLVEGGAAVVGSLIREGLVDKFYVFKAPKILGGGDGVPMASGPGPRTMEGALLLRDIRIRRFGDDLLLIGYPAGRS